MFERAMSALKSIQDQTIRNAFCAAGPFFGETVDSTDGGCPLGELSPKLRAQLHRYHKRDGLLIVFETHDTPAAGHLGRDKTFAQLSQMFWWPKMYKWVGTYVRTCESAEQDDWEDAVMRLLFAINTSVDATRRETPFFLVHGWDARSTVSAMLSPAPQGRDKLDATIAAVSSKAIQSTQPIAGIPLHHVAAQTSSFPNYEPARMDFMIAAGVRIGAYEGAVRLPDEERIPLASTGRPADNSSSATRLAIGAKFLTEDDRLEPARTISRLAETYKAVAALDNLTSEEQEAVSYYHEGTDHLLLHKLRSQLAVLPDLVVNDEPADISKADVGEPDESSPEEVEQVREILRKHRAAFLGSGNAVPPPARGVVCDIEVPAGTKPISQRARRIPVHLLEKVYELIKKLLEAGIIEYSDSEWASPVVIVMKKNGLDIRLCIDYRLVNQLITLMSYPLPLIDEMLDNFDKAMCQVTPSDQAARQTSAEPADNSSSATRLVIGAKFLTEDDRLEPARAISQLAETYKAVAALDNLTSEEQEAVSYYHEGTDHLLLHKLRSQLAVLPDLVVNDEPADISKADVGEQDESSPEEVEQVREILRKHRAAFLGSGNAVPPPARGVVCDIEVPAGTKPISQRARRIPVHLLEKVYELIKKLLEAGIIEYSDSEWASPVVIVMKKNGLDIRLCIDYRLVNQLITLMSYPLPLIDEMLDNFDKAMWFLSLDLAHVKREFNSPADFLASKALQGDNVHVSDAEGLQQLRDLNKLQRSAVQQNDSTRAEINAEPETDQHESAPA
ncbi:hypothetical protein ATCC90586_003995 [Pythium insidiosum]|nr:hypothetical protein ATCC90586_003995 [Pythium insidiosum]